MEANMSVPHVGLDDFDWFVCVYIQVYMYAYEEFEKFAALIADGVIV